jgi:hypothetical protein
MMKKLTRVPWTRKNSQIFIQAQIPGTKDGEERVIMKISGVLVLPY